MVYLCKVVYVSAIKMFMFNKMKNQKGFTLLEVIIAIALSGIIASGILISLGTLTKTFINVDTHEIAKDIAISDMENIRSQPFADNYCLLMSSLNPSAEGQSVTFTATVTPGTATGTVTFFDGGIALGPAVNLSSGQATYTTSAMTAVGSPHYITAVYSGNGTTSSVFTQRVNPPSTAASSTPPPIYQNNVTITWLNMNEQKIDITISLSGKTLFTLTDYRVNY